MAGDVVLSAEMSVETNNPTRIRFSSSLALGLTKLWFLQSCVWWYIIWGSLIGSSTKGLSICRSSSNALLYGHKYLWLQVVIFFGYALFLEWWAVNATQSHEYQLEPLILFVLTTASSGWNRWSCHVLVWIDLVSYEMTKEITSLISIRAIMHQGLIIVDNVFVVSCLPPWIVSFDYLNITLKWVFEACCTMVAA